MVVKPFEVTQPRSCAGDMQMQSRRAVTGKIDVKRLAKVRNLQETRYATASRDIGLLNVDGLRRQHMAYIVERVSVLPRGDFHSGRRSFANLAQPREIVGRYRLLEPANPYFGE